MPLVQHRLPHFLSGLLLGVVASVLLLSVWWSGKKDVETVAVPQRELLVPERGDWRIRLEPAPGWRVEADSSFVREIVDGQEGDARALTPADLTAGLSFSMISGKDLVGPPKRSIQLGILVCWEDAPKVCRAESHTLNIRSSTQGQVSQSVIVGK